MSSIMIPMGVSVELYDNDGFSGQPLTLSGRAWQDSDQKMYCENLSDHDGWNDKVSSMSVFWQNNGLSRGYWHDAASGQQVEFSVSVGFDTIKSESETVTE